MTAQESIRISLELDAAAEPITGRVCDPSGGVRAFYGWLGLFAALEAATADLGRRSRESTTQGEVT
jgi:hypothetical protein